MHQVESATYNDPCQEKCGFLYAALFNQMTVFLPLYQDYSSWEQSDDTNLHNDSPLTWVENSFILPSLLWVSSRTAENLSAAQVLTYLCRYWTIENGVFRVAMSVMRKIACTDGGLLRLWLCFATWLSICSGRKVMLTSRMAGVI
jgi:hypothetical protein